MTYFDFEVWLVRLYFVLKIVQSKKDFNNFSRNLDWKAYFMKIDQKCVGTSDLAKAVIVANINIEIDELNLKLKKLTPDPSKRDYTGIKIVNDVSEKKIVNEWVRKLSKSKSDHSVGSSTVGQKLILIGFS